MGLKIAGKKPKKKRQKFCFWVQFLLLGLALPLVGTISDGLLVKEVSQDCTVEALASETKSTALFIALIISTVIGAGLFLFDLVWLFKPCVTGETDNFYVLAIYFMEHRWLTKGLAGLFEDLPQVVIALILIDSLNTGSPLTIFSGVLGALGLALSVSKVLSFFCCYRSKNSCRGKCLKPCWWACTCLIQIGLIILIAGSLIAAYISIGALNTDTFAWVALPNLTLAGNVSGYSNLSIEWAASEIELFDPSQSSLDSLVITATLSLPAGLVTFTQEVPSYDCDCLTMTFSSFAFQEDELSLILVIYENQLGSGGQYNHTEQYNGPLLLTSTRTFFSLLAPTFNLDAFLQVGSCDLSQDPAYIDL